MRLLQSSLSTFRPATFCIDMAEGTRTGRRNTKPVSKPRGESLACLEKKVAKAREAAARDAKAKGLLAELKKLQGRKRV